MGSLFRSEDMTLCQLFLQVESAYQAIAELGDLGLAQFRDLNPELNSFQRKFIGEVKRCNDVERRLYFIEKEITRCDIPIFDKSKIDSVVIPQAKDLTQLEAKFEKHESELLEVIKSQDELHKTLNELRELRFLLEKAQAFFDLAEVTSNPWSEDGGLGGRRATIAVPEMPEDAPSGNDAPRTSLTSVGQPAKRKKSIFSRGIDFSRRFTVTTSLQVCFVSGVIANARLHTFEKLLWRVCRGNVFFRSCAIDVPLESLDDNEETVNKSAFFIFFQGEELRTRILKICEGCRATMYPCPETAKDRQEALTNVISRLTDLETVIERTQEHRQRLLGNFARNITTWKIQVKKIKAVYTTLNQFQYDVQVRCLIGEAWIPNFAITSAREALTRASTLSGSNVASILNTVKETDEPPPTYHKTNKLTSGFQGIVDAYGIANYKEVNPAPFTVITFPFLFAVMFGDTGHGFIMALAAIYLIKKEDAIISLAPKNEIFMTFFNGRYIICLMGLFSMYTGLLYNDVFGKSLNLFHSSWTATPTDPQKEYQFQQYLLENPNASVMLDPRYHLRLDEPYPFGIDPIWSLASNKILFLNSYKMKLSVLLGVTHMLFGTFLSFFNHVQFVKPLNILCELVPQILFMTSIFGYMNVLIVYKWLKYTPEMSGKAPSILLAVIDMFMGREIKETIYPAQPDIQKILVVIAIICIPWMLFIKPIVLKLQSGSKNRKMSASLEQVVTNDSVAAAEETTSSSSKPIPENTANGSPEKEPVGSVTYQAAGSSGDGQVTLHVPEGKGRQSVSSIKSTRTDEGEDEFDFGEVFIHQAIHTIEYCLGSVSNTASYLRLWALSLAHAQLSEVLWQMVMKRGITFGSGTLGSAIVTFFVFIFWSSATVTILILMEGLSAFLHAIRLHWVEFQSKFYGGEGIPFTPFSFKNYIESDTKEID